MRSASRVLFSTLLAILIAARFSVAQETSDGRVYVVPYSHLDTQFRWTTRDTIGEFLPWTLDENFKLLEEFPDYRFSFTGAARYAWIKEYYPERWERVRDYVKEGRWHPAGALLDEVDVNVPSPESLIRHALYADLFFQKEFGKSSRDLVLTDSFGFSHALPTIAAHCGFTGFSSDKLTWGPARPIPFDIGRWIGPDGSELVSVLTPGAFSSRITSDPRTEPATLVKAKTLQEKAKLPVAFRFYGAGAHGGAPDRDSVAWMQAAKTAQEGSLRVIHADSEQLFRDLTANEKARLPEYRGELLMRTHGVGTYTAASAMKRWNRQNEILGDLSERAATSASWLGALPYPKARLREHWERFLTHQMHDDLSGVASPNAYAISWNDEFLSANGFARVFEDSIETLARNMDTRGDGMPLLVYNPLDRERDSVAEFEVERAGVEPRDWKIFNAAGEAVLSQVLEQRDGTIRLAFLARVPAVGSAIYHARPEKRVHAPAAIPAATKNTEGGEPEDTIQKDDLKSPAKEGAPEETEEKMREYGELRIGSKALENARYRVVVNEDGDIASVFDKQLGKELLSSPIHLQLRPSRSIERPAWRIYYQAVSTPAFVRLRDVEKIEADEEGPARVSLKIQRSSRHAKYVQRVRLSAGGGRDSVELETHIDWAERGVLLKMAFPLASANAMATYDLGVGTIQRGTNTPELYEVPAQRWADLSAADGSFGVTIGSDCKYGWDKPDEHTLRSTLLHSPETTQVYVDHSFMEEGRHRMVHTITGHAGNWAVGGIPAKVEEAQSPLPVFVCSPHDGVLKKSFSFCKVTAKGTRLRALKKAERSDEIVIRLQETHGKSEDVLVEFAATVQSAREINGIEEELRPATIKDGKLVVKIGAYQPRAFAVTLAGPSGTMPMPEQQTLALAFTKDVVAPPAERLDFPISMTIGALPKSLWPGEVWTGGVRFVLGPADEPNAVVCAAQTVKLGPSKGVRKLHLLAAANGEDVAAAMSVGGKKLDWFVPQIDAVLGQWDRVPFTSKWVRVGPRKDGFVKLRDVALTLTHWIDPQGVLQHYRFCHMYRQVISIPNGVTSIDFPKDRRILIFAATIVSDDGREATLACEVVDSMEYWTDPTGN